MVPIEAKRAILFIISKAPCYLVYLCNEDIRAFWYSQSTRLFQGNLNKMLQGPWTQAIAASSFPPLPSPVSRETETSSHTNTPKKILWTPKLTNVSILPKPPISQSPGKQLKDRARKTCYFSGQALTSLPTKHSPMGHIPHMVRLRLLCLIWNQQLPDTAQGNRGQVPKHAPKVQVGLCTSILTQTSLFCKSPLMYLERPLHKGDPESIHSPLSLVPRTLSTWPNVWNKRLCSAQSWCLSVLWSWWATGLRQRREGKPNMAFRILIVPWNGDW